MRVGCVETRNSLKMDEGWVFFFFFFRVVVLLCDPASFD